MHATVTMNATNPSFVARSAVLALDGKYPPGYDQHVLMLDELDIFIIFMLYNNNNNIENLCRLTTTGVHI